MIIKRKRDSKFFTMPNDLANDERLSFAAKGLMAYLLSKPGNWKVRIKDVMRAGNIGRDAAYNLINMLIACGYAKREQRRLPSGKLGEMEIVISDANIERVMPVPENPEAVNSPVPGLPDTVQPDTVNQEHNKERLLQKTDSLQKTDAAARANDNLKTDRSITTEATKLFNGACRNAGHPEHIPEIITAKRRDNIRRRVDHVGLVRWGKAMNKLASPDCWLWTWKNFSLDWLIKNDDNLVKLIEGQYDRKETRREDDDDWKFLNDVKRGIDA